MAAPSDKRLPHASNLTAETFGLRPLSKFILDDTSYYLTVPTTGSLLGAPFATKLDVYFRTTCTIKLPKDISLYRQRGKCKIGVS